MNDNVGDMPIDIFCDYIQDATGQEWEWSMLLAINDTAGPDRFWSGSGEWWHMTFDYDDNADRIEVAIGHATLLPGDSPPGDGYFVTNTFGRGDGDGDHLRLTCTDDDEEEEMQYIG